MPTTPINHDIEEGDSDFHTGSVEDGRDGQLLPVWASTEPGGYAGTVADQQIVGGGDRPFDAKCARMERERIGPDVS